MNSKYTFKTEETLVKVFIENLQSEKKNFIIREVDCWQGRADVVEVVSNNILDQLDKFTDEQINLLRNLTCANIFSILNYNAVRSRNYIYNKIGIQKKTIDTWLLKLINAEMVSEITKDRFIISPTFVLPSVRFTAYEVKLHNWKRALYQAIQYRGFSNKSYVVMPQKNIKPAIKNRLDFIANNIGLIAVDDNGKHKILLKPKNKKPTGKSYKLIGIGIALNQIKHFKQKSLF